MSLAELYTKRGCPEIHVQWRCNAGCQEARVWIPDPETVWKGATLEEDFVGQKKLRVRYDDGGETTVVDVKTPDGLPPLRNPDILVGENDLTSLSYLHEPAVQMLIDDYAKKVYFVSLGMVLYNLQVRFCERNYIYTYCGIVLVAINPYYQLPIYDNDTIHAYSGQDMANMDPHIFAVGEEAFKRLSRFEENQSIIVSGESGAGKTVSAKYAMRYFATVCGAEAETQIEKRVLASNPIMEAFGNAKTTRNDNSSRFGKYIQIGFSKNNTIMGANMRTYLLEKSRVVFQATEERNYHIFYQLCSSYDCPEYSELKLDHPDRFCYSNQGAAPTVDSIDDVADLIATREAFCLMGINELRQMEIFRILSGILHMGNIVIKGENRSADNCSIDKSDEHMELMAELLGIDLDQMRFWLCNRKIVTATEVLNKPLTAKQACFSRDALAKHIYSQLFNWIVAELNKILLASYKTTKFIGVLDIYGFETFEVNSFEQFCINYANEKLQQQFCLHVFKLEQEEYVREEIEWSFIDFHDNQPCIDLIEGRLGILDLLDEECKMPSASDRNWCQKLYDKHTTSKHFVKPRMSQTSFIILHFADRVEYQMDGFVEKNRDTVLEEHINILKASQYELVAELFQEKQAEASTPGRTQRSVTRPAREPPKSSSQQRQMRKTVGSQFRESLTLLMETLFKTTPHYVRCIKPNDSKMSFSFDPKRAVQQLRACGVLETIRISAAGYPSRWTYSEFFQRYRVLAKSREIQRSNMRKTCENILHKLIQDRDKYQFGKSKIFFRAGQVAYLEKLRSDRLRECGILIQKYIRGWLAKMRYTKIRRTALLVQTYGRGMLARRQAMHLKRTQCATLIQATWRRFHQQQLYKRVIRAAISIQAFARGVFGRERFISMRANAKAVIIQRHVRGWLARIRYRKVRHGFIMLQAHVRRHAAKKELKKLKIEARSVEHMKNVARGLENKIIELQQKLTEKNKEVAVLREDQLQLIEMKNEVTRLRSAVQSAKQTADRLLDLERLVEQLKAELEKEKTEKSSCLVEIDCIKKDRDQLVGDLTSEKLTLKEQLEKVNELIKQKEVEQEVLVHEKVDEARQQLLSEFNTERTHHQKMVKDFTRLQQRFENLKGDMQVLASPPGGAPVYKRQGSGNAEAAVGAEEVGEGFEKDPGYGSGRRKEKFVTKEEEVDWDGQELDSISETQSEEKESSNLSLVSRLQMRIKQLEWERALLRREVDRKEAKLDGGGGGEGGGKSGDDLEKEIYESIKLQDLETENESIRKDLMDLQKAVVDDKDLMVQGLPHAGKSAKLILDQFDAMNEELVRRREECIHLRTVLASSARTAKDTEDRDLSSLNEDGELEMAYKTQKDLNKLLANEIQRLQKTSGDQEKELRSQIDELRRDNNRQQKLIGQSSARSKNLTMTPQAKMEATMQHEITRLTSENLDLREQIDKLQEQIKKLKKVLKIYAKRLKSTEGEWRLSRLMSRSFSFASEVQEDLEREMAVDENMPAVKHYHQREYSGMFEYRKEEEMLLVKNLVMDLRPRIAAQQLPGLPSYVLFMCIRHTDYMNDDEKVRSLLTNTINGIKKVVKKHQEDLEMITLWLANTCRLLHSLKQYSGEKVFQTSNTPKQNEHCLRNFDLSEYRQILSDLAVWIFQGLIKLTEAQIHPTIVGAILEHEAIAGLSAGKPTGLRGRVLSNARRENVDDKNKDVSLDSLIKALENLYRVLTVHAVDPELINQIFRQVFYFICANSLNNLLLRKDMCHWTKGMQMRYNLSHLEQWLRDHKMQETGGVQLALEPIVQASQLLQARKTDSDVDSICDMCSRLTTSQIIKILNLYTPVNEFEERVPISFIRKIQDRLTSRHDSTQTLLMDTKFLYAITFPFNPSDIGLDTIGVPIEWGLGFLKRL